MIPSRRGEGDRDRLADRGVGRGFFERAVYEFCDFLSQLTAILLFDVRLFGGHRVPAHGGVVVASNHQSFLDPWIVGMCIRRPAHYLARDTLFKVPVLGRLLRILNTHPIPRGTAASRRGIESGRAVLRAGEPLVLFPEGTRSRDGRLGSIKRGVEIITRPSMAPVVPVYVAGSFESWPPGCGFPRPHPVRVFFGEAIPVEGGEEGEIDGEHGLEKSCADLVSRLEASYRSLEVRARGFCRAGAVPVGRPQYFG